MHERRESTRFRLRDLHTNMTWVNDSEQSACEAEVIDISGGGARLLVGRPPPAGMLVQIQFQHQAISATVVAADAVAVPFDRAGRHSVRLKFSRWLPLESIGEHHQERRSWQRFPVRENRVALTCPVADSLQTFRGELSNIGGGGAAIIVDDFLPDDASIWFELVTEGATIDPIESRLVVTSLDPSGTKIARIRFLDPCPILVFNIAVHGSP